MAWFPASSLCWWAHTWNQRTGCLFCSPWATALRLQVTAYISVLFNLMLFVLFYDEKKVHQYTTLKIQPFLYIHFVLWFPLSAEEHQSQLVQCGGLPFLITLLTEDSNEEVRKAVTFILQSCKQASKLCWDLFLHISYPSINYASVRCTLRMICQSPSHVLARSDGQ